ncbi:MAG: hypothetical protein RL060_792 [Bacteroidota bacterium]|jgi:hypothetical protein
MKPKSIIYLICFIIGLSINSQAQELSVKPDKLKHSIGLGAGFATGYGLSYRYTPQNYGFQVNFAPFKNKETTRISAGLTFSYDLKEYKSTRLYVYQANHFYYNNETSQFYDMYSVPYTQRTKESYFNNGLGFGLEITMLERIGLNLMSGYAFYDNFNGLNVTGEMSIYYKF